MKMETLDKLSESVDAIAEFIDELPLPYLEIDARGVITRANLATREMHPPEQGNLIGLLAWEAMPLGEREQNCAAYLMLMETGKEPGPVHRNVYVRGGGFRTYEMHRKLMRDAAGKPIGMRVLSVDVTDMKHKLAEIQVENRWLECSLQSAPEAIVITDAIGYIQRFNAAAEALLGWKAAEVVAQAVENCLQILSYTSPQGTDFNHALTMERRTEGLAAALDREGRPLQLKILTSPVIDKKSGVAIGSICVLSKVDATSR
jgi:PAS domain S-box-containing protein